MGRTLKRATKGGPPGHPLRLYPASIRSQTAHDRTFIPVLATDILGCLQRHLGVCCGLAAEGEASGGTAEQPTAASSCQTATPPTSSSGSGTPPVPQSRSWEPVAPSPVAPEANEIMHPAQLLCTRMATGK